MHFPQVETWGSQPEEHLSEVNAPTKWIFIEFPDHEACVLIFSSAQQVALQPLLDPGPQQRLSSHPLLHAPSYR